MGKKKNTKRRRQTSGLKEHQQFKKTLMPPLAKVNPTYVRWNPDSLPEMLIIDAVVNQLGWEYAPKVLHRAFDILDEFAVSDAGEILLGDISSLRLIPENSRDNARLALIKEDVFDILLPEGLKHGLALYPQCPVFWLIAEWKENNTVDWEMGTQYLKDAVRRLWGSKDVYSTRCRMIPIARMMEHGKIHFSAEIETIQLLPKYPSELTEEQQALVESWSRVTFNAFYALFDKNKSSWAPYFWRHSYEISPCQQLNYELGREAVSEEQIYQAITAIAHMTKSFTRAFEKFALQAKLDIYDLDRDEVIFGLISRQYRIFETLVSNISLWSMDLGSMFHRVMVDTLITLKWLTYQKDQNIFQRFKEFSLGKLKLTKLHIEELVDQGRDDLSEVENLLSEIINEEIWEETLNIDLGGNFAGKDTRTMAQEVGLKDIYNLVYAPASAELHGEWSSLKRHNLVRCGNPLHRFHRLPRLAASNTLSMNSVLMASGFLTDTFKVCLDFYSLQHLEVEIADFVSSIEGILMKL